MSHLNVKRLFLATTIFLAGCASNNARIDVVKEYVQRGDCVGAENYARQNVSGDLFYGLMGGIAMECRRDRRAAIEYFKMGARMGNAASAGFLIQLGETPPEPTRQVIIQQQPAPQPQQIIIQQAPIQMPNPAACIQDGGSTMCLRR